MKTVLEKLKGFRTIIFNVATAVGGVLWGPEAVEAVASLGVGLDGAEKGLIAAWAAINILLRVVTTTPVGQKTAE